MNQFETPLSGFRYIELRWGESLQSVALRELGDAARWIDIANLNGLHPPYVTAIAAEVSSQVVLYGARLLVPAPTPMASISTNPELVFERDVQVVDGALTVTNGDINLVSGVQNLTQAIKNRLATDKNDLLYHSQYGCDIRLMLGTNNSAISEFLAAEYARSALKSDPRIKDVPSATVSITGDQLRVDAEVVPIDQRRIQFGGYF